MPNKHLKQETDDDITYLSDDKETHALAYIFHYIVDFALR